MTNVMCLFVQTVHGFIFCFPNCSNALNKRAAKHVAVV